MKEYREALFTWALDAEASGDSGFVTDATREHERAANPAEYAGRYIAGVWYRPGRFFVSWRQRVKDRVAVNVDTLEGSLAQYRESIY